MNDQPANASPLPPLDPVPDEPDYEFETKRAKRRQQDMNVDRPDGHSGEKWALALSGGGIRSATFCLGALQGMQKTAPPRSAEDSEGCRTSMLRQFDYLSTVSGGGYIGCFFSSLFVPNRLDHVDKPPPLTPEISREVAEKAYSVFEEDPPKRLRHETVYDPEKPGVAALAWLRENGRYLIPSGAGDMSYALAIHIRNWCATHYVLGTVFLGIFALLAAIRSLIIHFGLPDKGTSPPGMLEKYAAYEKSILQDVLCTISCPLDLSSIWWSPWWWLVLPVIAVWTLPSGLAFWLTHPGQGGSVSDPARRWSYAAGVCLFIGIVLLGVGWAVLECQDNWLPLAALLGAGGLFSVLGTVRYVFTARPEKSTTAKPQKTIASQRVLLTRDLSNSMLCAAFVAAVAFLDTCAQTLYIQGSNLWHMLSPAVAAGALVWLARQISNMTNERKTPSWLTKIPLSVIAGIAGIVLVFLVAVMWNMAVLWIQWDGANPDLSALASQKAHLPYLVATLLALAMAVALALATGQFPGFLNLSTLQGFYSARITRAYLGASNSVRFEKGNQKTRSVAEPVPGDHMKYEDLYLNPYAPMHIINTCMNLTSDPGEQLVQSDRKGKPLAVVPGGLSYDNETHPMPDGKEKKNKKNSSELSAPLTVGEWIGVSGAAFTTGLGRSTSLGFSLLLGLANVRLGRWWPSQIRAADLKVKDVRWRKWFRTQTYLISEILGRFYGTRREWQYLSDGGHFENTAAYELLRKDRDVKLIVICDCGADPDYEFADLANLTRLARIDLGTEIEEHVFDETKDKELLTVFGSTTDFRDCGKPKLPKHNKCAILFNVYHDSPGPRQECVERSTAPDARIILLKPRLLAQSSADLREYRATHPAFPQEPTADQFFDEAQWESYRRLGMEIAMRVFPGEHSTSTYKAAFARVIG